MLVDESLSSERCYNLKKPDIMFVEPELGLGSRLDYPTARALARERRAALGLDVCVRLVVIKTSQDLARSSAGRTELNETYDSDDLGDSDYGLGDSYDSD